MDIIKDSWGTVIDAIMDGWGAVLDSIKDFRETVMGAIKGAVLDSSCRIVLESHFNSTVRSTSDVSWALSISPVNSRSSSLMSPLSLASGTTTDLGGCSHKFKWSVLCWAMHLSIDCIYIIIIITIPHCI